MAVKADPNSVTRSKTELKRPRMYRVVFYNDDFTPMDFVVDILQHIFGKTPSEAYSLMTVSYTHLTLPTTSRV